MFRNLTFSIKRYHDVTLYPGEYIFRELRTPKGCISVKDFKVSFKKLMKLESYLEVQHFRYLIRQVKR